MENFVPHFDVSKEIISMFWTNQLLAEVLGDDRTTILDRLKALAMLPISNERRLLWL